MSIKHSQNLDKIDMCFDNIQQNLYVDKSVLRIQELLGDEFGVEVAIEIVHEHPDSELYFMKVYPSELEQNEFASKLAQIETGHPVAPPNVKSIVILIDSRCLKNEVCTPRELSAILLHEVGHFITGRPYSRVWAMINKIIETVTLPVRFIAVVAFIIFNFLTNSTKYMLSLTDTKEVEADSLAVKYGYGVELTTVLGKFAKGSIFDLARVLKWFASGVSTSDYLVRSGEVVNMLKAELKNTSSVTERKMIQKQLDIITRKNVGDSVSVIGGGQ